MFTDRKAYSLHSMNQKATVNIHGKKKSQSIKGINEELVCERAKISSLLHYITQFNRVVLTLFSCCR